MQEQGLQEASEERSPLFSTLSRLVSMHEQSVQEHGELEEKRSVCGPTQCLELVSLCDVNICADLSGHRGLCCGLCCDPTRARSSTEHSTAEHSTAQQCREGHSTIGSPRVLNSDSIE